MIQRIQSVYLLLSTVLCVLCQCFPVGRFTSEEHTLQLYNLMTECEGARSFTYWVLFALMVIVASFSVIAIFIYKQRTMQMRVTILNIILLVGYYAVYGVFAYLIAGSMPSAVYAPGWALSLPFVVMVLQYLAFRAILRDDRLVKSLDRLR